MRIKNLDVGVERITQWNVGDEVHLPEEGKLAPTFLPAYRPLDAILRRPSLDERLPELLQPASLDPSLLEPAALSRTRDDLRRFFRRRAEEAAGPDQAVFAAADAALGVDQRLDREVSAALAILLQG